MDERQERLSGIPVSEGIAIGRAYLYRPQSSAAVTADAAGESALAQYENSLTVAAQQLAEIYERLSAAADGNAKIFEAQQEILADEEMDLGVRELLEDGTYCACEAIEEVYEQFATILARAKDPLIAARAADIRDVKARLQRILSGEVGVDLSNLPEGTVLVAHDLMPSDTAQLDATRIAAIVTELGNQTTHTAILSRSLGIPAILGVQDALTHIPQGTEVAVDAFRGEILCQPTDEMRRELESRRLRFENERRLQQEYLHREAVTTDGTHVEIGINIGGSETDFSSCDYCGLFRTEFLFLNSQELPDEQLQFEQYLYDVEPCTIATMAYLIGVLSKEIQVPYGVDVATDPYKVYDLAAAAKASFVRETFTGAYAGDYGVVSYEMGKIHRHRAKVGAKNVRTFCTLVPECSLPLANRPIEEVARSTDFYFQPDVYLVSGLTAGCEADSQTITRVKSATKTPVFANNGVRLENVDRQLEVADGCIIGTTFKRDGQFYNEVDEERVSRFMKRVREIRGER